MYRTLSCGTQATSIRCKGPFFCRLFYPNQTVAESHLTSEERVAQWRQVPGTCRTLNLCATGRTFSTFRKSLTPSSTIPIAIKNFFPVLNSQPTFL